MLKIDALGKACPLPVIETHKALKENDGVEITVDNEIATQNLKRLADEMGYTYAVTTESPTHYTVTINKVAGAKGDIKDFDSFVETLNLSGDDSYIVVIDSPYMGVVDTAKGGKEDFARTLLKTFINTLTEQDVLPKEVIFFNGGVPLVAEGSESVEDLKKLAAHGVKIYACGACLNYYGLADKVQVGEITNMFSIIEMMRKASRIVRP